LFRRGRAAYTGRSDSNVERRARASVNEGNYDTNYSVYFTSSPRRAYIQECRLFHRHKPSDNSIHPRVPVGANWRCPIKSCPWS
jgi:hypothetical protein